jgi:glycosyltransferase involved in cell wall biosynthesis
LTRFTVAICTFRRTDLLPRTLASLAQIDRPDVPFDVLVVDNGCEPAVEAIVQNATGSLPIRYVQEPAVGIARARNRAVNSTQAPFLFFCDDDVVFDRQWLKAMWNAVTTHDDCDFWGGRIDPAWDVPRPAWFDIDRCPMLGDSIVRYDLGGQPRAWDPQRDPPFYTCNLALRTEAVRAAGMFDVTLGHQGAKRGGGEDSWMIRSIARRGGRGWYAADALLHHPVPASRLTKKHARAFAWWQGRVGIDMLRRENALGEQARGKLPRWAYRAALQGTLAAAGRALVTCASPNRGTAFTAQFQTIYQFSRLYHALAGSQTPT